MGGVDRDRLAQLLAAVGNHEGKALMFLAMEDGVDYGVSALHQRFLEIQGHPLVFEGTVNLQQKYVVHSFEPAGLAVRALADGRWLRHTKLDADHRGSALAAHLLAYTEAHPSSLTQIFGKSAKGPMGLDRAPIRRVDAFRVLARAAGPISQADLSRLSALRPKGGLTYVANALLDAGLVDYQAQPTFELKTAYRVHGPITVPSHAKELTRAVVDHLNARFAAGGAFDVSRDQIEDHILADPRWEHRYIRDTLQRVMGRLCDGEGVETLKDYRGRTHHSVMVVSADQQAFLAGLVALLDKVMGGDEPTIGRGVRLGRELVASPERVRRLLRRGFDSNKLVVNPVSSEAKQSLVLRALQDGPATSKELTERLEPLLNKTSVANTLHELRHRGLVEGVAQLRSPQKLWRLTAGT